MPRIAVACSSASLAVVGELDAARLAAAADQHLGLDHDRVAELVGGLDGLLHGGRVAPVRHGHAVLGEELLALVFEKVHWRGRYERCAAARGSRTLSKRLNGTPKERQVRHVRLLRHPDRLGVRVVRRIPEGGRPRRIHDRPRRADPAVHRHPARDPARLVRAVRRGPAPHGRARGGGAAAGSSSPRARTSCPTACPRWPPSARPTRSSSASPRSTSWASSRTSTTSCSASTRRHFRVDFDLVVTAQQVRSYKPDPAHFKECARRIGRRKKNWVHIASGYPTDVEPCRQGADPGDLGQPPRRGGSRAPASRTPRSRPSATPASCSRPRSRLARRLGQPGRAGRDERASGRPTRSRCARARRRC